MEGHFISFCKVSVDRFIKTSESSKYFTIFTMSLTSLLESITAVPVPCIFFLIPPSIPDIAADNPKGAKTFFQH